MPIEYVLRGTQQGKPIEREGELTNEQISEDELKQDSAVINVVIRNLKIDGPAIEWEECLLKDASIGKEDLYKRHKKRWTHASKIHSYKG